MTVDWLIERFSDVAAAVGANADEQRALGESSKRLSGAGEVEDAKALLNQALGIDKANDRIMMVLRRVMLAVEFGADWPDADAIGRELAQMEGRERR